MLKFLFRVKSIYFKNNYYTFALEHLFLFVINSMKRTFINKLKTFFPSYPVEKAWVFGSYARGEEKGESDIDIMVRFKKDAHITLFDYAGIINDLEVLFQKKIDLVQ